MFTRSYYLSDEPRWIKNYNICRNVTVHQSLRCTGIQPIGTMSDSNDVWEFPDSGMRDELEDSSDANEFSEHELLDIMYNSCNTSSTGEVSASCIIQYLHNVTSQSHQQGHLTSLQQLLDPECQDPMVSREMFHLTMKEWIAQCSQDRGEVNISGDASYPDASELPVNGFEFSTPTTKPTPTDSQQCACNEKDLSATVSELKQAHRKLSEQNSSLLRTVAHCEDVNLQLTLEITELRAKLASSQRSAVRARSITEELEETRRAFKEAQERASRMQATCTKLSNEVECLKVHIRRLEDKNEKLSFEKTCSEDGINKLRKVNAELKADLQEVLVMLTLKDREMTKKDIVMDKMKSSHAENHNLIEGVQAELMRLHEHSHQVLSSYDRLCISPQTLYGREPPNLRSLQSEMQDLQQQNHRAVDEKSLPPLHTECEDIQSIIRRIKSSEIAHLWRNKHLEKVSSSVESQEKPFPEHQQQQASIKQQLVNVLQDLELQKCVREEKGEKVDERSKAWEQEQKPNQTGKSIPQSKKVAIVKWWKTLSVEGAKARTGETKTFRELSERARLHQAEHTITDMREQVCHLQTSLKYLTEQKSRSRVVLVHKETNTEREDTDSAESKRVKEQRDASVATGPVHSPGGGASQQRQVQFTVAADALLGALRRTEAIVKNALESSKLVNESEKRLSRVRVRMEGITQRVEAALGRTADADLQLNSLEVRIVEKNNQSCPELSTGPDHLTECVAPEKERMETPPPPPHVIPEAITQRDEIRRDRQLFTSHTTAGTISDTEQDSCDKVAEEAKDFLQASIQHNTKESSKHSTAEGIFFFPLTRSRPCQLPAMPTLPEEEEDSPEDLDSSSSSPSTCAPADSGAGIMTGPTMVYPQQASIVQQDGRPLEQAKPHSPRARLARNSSAGSITTVDSAGHVIDLVKDKLPEMQLSEEDRQRNLELLEQAKKVSDRFLMRRGRRSTSSLSDSTTVVGVPEVTCTPQSISQHLDVASVRGQKDVESVRLAVDWKPTEKRKVSSGTLTPRFTIPKENCESKSPPGANKSEDGGRNSNQTPATGVAKPVPRPPTQQAPCTAEIKTIGAFPPLMRAVSWDAIGGINSRNGAEDTSSDKARDGIFKSPGLKELPAPKLSKFREEHKLMRNQTIVGSKLPDLSEAAEQEKGPASSPNSAPSSEETKSDAMPNISDIMLRKLKLHRGLPGCPPPLTEKEVENAFVQLSLAFRNDNYTLETRLKQAERERNLTEEDTQKELEEFKVALKMTSPQWQNLEQREAYQRLIDTLAVLHRLATRLSSRSEIVGAVRQEKRMSKATEVMMQYVENLKRTYEKDHAELTEFKKLANQNSNRCYGGSVETGDDGVSRASRSMSLTLGKALPRRRVSVAVVPKFNLLNIPGQMPPTTAAPNVPTASMPGAALPALSEASDVKGNSSPESTQQATTECGKSASEQEGEPAKPAVNLEEIRAEIRAELKAKIEEVAYNKGYQEGLKQNKAIQEEKHEVENEAAEKLLDSKIRDEESGKKIKASRRMEEVLLLLSRIRPKISWRKRLLWMALMIFLVMCLVISILTFFSGYNKRDDS
ncbi:uncharacterized protein mrvi1 isoform X3 [Hippocampus zosterae]|uniref:uncharacterized protein mrvi1 isoform X3 n=1 Tax=Hippocampus zosterae TaxID=109293 RepID=UPI00223E7FC9|nr:uncharacterized protein mrvi1 isoform X3 [Hippocampus zosterae]